MKAAQLIFRFFIKLLANMLKVLCYGFHTAFPKMRFQLPSFSKPLRGSSARESIPKTIWQTNFTSNVTLPVYLNYLFNRLMAPSFSYRFMVTEEREKFIFENFDATINDSYKKLQIGAAQADFWRLLVLYKHGGVYMDIDAHLVWSLGQILSDCDRELYLKIKTGEISNYFIASVAGNKNLIDLIDRVCRNIDRASSDNVYYLTGPGVFNEVLAGRNVPTRYYLYTCNQGNFTNEYFQYIDKPQGKWTKEQKKINVINRN